MRYAIGDIHGGSRTLRALLAAIGLHMGDRLYLLGDYVDRGNDSRGVLDTILALTAAGHDIRPLRGNHDDMFLRCLQGHHDRFSLAWRQQWGEQTLASFGAADCSAVPPTYTQLLAATPLIGIEDDFVLVHAGLDMHAPDPLTDTEGDFLLWGDALVVDRQRLGGRRLITGHRIRRLAEVKASLQRDHICLDNGAFTAQLPDYGHLAALNLDTMVLTLQPWLDGETVW